MKSILVSCKAIVYQPRSVDDAPVSPLAACCILCLQQQQQQVAVTSHLRWRSILLVWRRTQTTSPAANTIPASSVRPNQRGWSRPERMTDELVRLTDEPGRVGVCRRHARDDWWTTDTCLDWRPPHCIYIGSNARISLILHVTSAIKYLQAQISGKQSWQNNRRSLHGVHISLIL